MKAQKWVYSSYLIISKRIKTRNSFHNFQKRFKRNEQQPLRCRTRSRCHCNFQLSHVLMQFFTRKLKSRWTPLQSWRKGRNSFSNTKRTKVSFHTTKMGIYLKLACNVTIRRETIRLSLLSKTVTKPSFILIAVFRRDSRLSGLPSTFRLSCAANDFNSLSLTSKPDHQDIQTTILILGIVWPKLLPTVHYLWKFAK